MFMVSSKVPASATTEWVFGHCCALRHLLDYSSLSFDPSFGVAHSVLYSLS